jgi:signal peptidase I
MFKEVPNKKNIMKNKQFQELAKTLIFVLVFVLTVRTWVYASYFVPTGSMIHSIEIGDRLFVSKSSYGLKVPFTDSKLFTQKVNRGDIVVFPSPEPPHPDFIKRIVAIGGDYVKIRGERVWVNGILEDQAHLFFDDRLLPIPYRMDLIVPQGKLWAMGDNRRNSHDSRYWGFVDESTVKGKGIIIYWSHDSGKHLFTGYRLHRIGNML